MGRFIDLTGKRFGRLSVISEAERSAAGNIRWRCLCDCGAESVAHGSSLRSGVTESCGCHHKDAVSRCRTKHGMTGKTEYRIWSGMIQRCTNADLPAFCWYGGRGIKVCDRWLKFENFYADMGTKPLRHSLDRINFDGDYEPSNCRWATAKDQARNMRTNYMVSFRNKKVCLKEAAEIAGLPYTTVYTRINRNGWSVDRALSEPVNR